MTKEIRYKGFNSEMCTREQGLPFNERVTYIKKSKSQDGLIGYETSATLKGLLNKFPLATSKYALVSTGGEKTRFSFSGKGSDTEITIDKILTGDEIRDILKAEDLKFRGVDLSEVSVVSATRNNEVVFARLPGATAIASKSSALAVADHHQAIAIAAHPDSMAQGVLGSTLILYDYCDAEFTGITTLKVDGRIVKESTPYSKR